MEGLHHHQNKGGRSLEVMDVRKLSENKMYLNQSQRRTVVDPSFVKRYVTKTWEPSKMKKSWWKKPEMKRRQRVAKYKLYAVEGKVKSSIKKGFRWIKTKCSRIISGF
ncbi:DUF3511 domain protein [Cucumis melo var. makuwa]|uniref:DUF3511 domain protein n=2 Tax=Cucumis melo TaxID=3656 RepID=A0A5D3BTT8_CUCMM|nr:DUF3511 domain protein [Cucumis melo var. makuwa]TYK02584.1 DUF3511 domain protein [Cucumis melo var. makuwa]